MHAGIQAKLEESQEAMKGFERKDIKLREDVKHLKGKLKKLSEKLTKDAAKADVRKLIHL